jgi:hypothetical protein
VPDYLNLPPAGPAPVGPPPPPPPPPQDDEDEELQLAMALSLSDQTHSATAAAASPASPEFHEALLVSAVVSPPTAAAAAPPPPVPVRPAWLPEGAIDIAVMGDSGTGKSTLINMLRALNPNEPGAAKVAHSAQGTREPTRYGFDELFQKLPGFDEYGRRFGAATQINLWDLPGAGTAEFSAADYVQRSAQPRVEPATRHESRAPRCPG